LPTATDADPSTVTRVQSSLLSQFPTAKLSITSTTSLDPLLASGIICLSPCATGGLLSKDSIPKIAAAGIKIVCGAANNQLLDVGTDGELLHQKGVLYCPDFVVNR
jgi:glutamate dehydrogenase/leucine dehydrogenase